MTWIAKWRIWLWDNYVHATAGNLVDDAPYTQLITKEVLTNDRKHLGHVDGFDNINIIVKNGLFNPQYYKIPRAKVDGYQNGKVLLNISEQDTKRQFKRKYPGYFKWYANLIGFSYWRGGFFLSVKSQTSEDLLSSFLSVVHYGVIIRMPQTKGSLSIWY